MNKWTKLVIHYIDNGSTYDMYAEVANDSDSAFINPKYDCRCSKSHFGEENWDVLKENVQQQLGYVPKDVEVYEHADYEAFRPRRQNAEHIFYNENE